MRDDTVAACAACFDTGFVENERAESVYCDCPTGQRLLRESQGGLLPAVPPASEGMSIGTVEEAKPEDLPEGVRWLAETDTTFVAMLSPTSLRGVMIEGMGMKGLPFKSFDPDAPGAWDLLASLAERKELIGILFRTQEDHDRLWPLFMAHRREKVATRAGYTPKPGAVPEEKAQARAEKLARRAKRGSPGFPEDQ